jgi:hypothetical protein
MEARKERGEREREEGEGRERRRQHFNIPFKGTMT